MNRAWIGALGLVFASSACEGRIGGAGADGRLSAAGPGGTGGGSTVLGEPASRASRRLSVAELRATLPIVFGNDLSGEPITWRVGDDDGLDHFADALGEADYLNIVEHNLEVSPLYAKFMDDAARDACGRAIEADFQRPNAADRVLTTKVELTDTVEQNPAGVDENLRVLRLRFHGMFVAPGDDAPLAGLRKVFADSTAKNENQPKEGWRAVCVALVTAPEFNLY